MSIIVQKFGGSSVANTEKLFKVCEHITREYKEGKKVVVVVSAQGKTTDKLISEEKEITNKASKREHDVLISTGEQITIAKLAMCLEELGYSAVSYMGWQLPILTDNNHGEARISKINIEQILEDLNNNKIVVVAGFQGIDENNNITTLGRGGSDTTAVALAAVLKAEKCDIYTDVDGVYTADPRIIKNAKKVETLTYDEMLELASLGAKVLHNRCVEIAKNFNIPIVVKSTFDEDSEKVWEKGSLVKYEKNLEGFYISGIAKLDNIAKITILNISNNMGEAYKLLKKIADNKINIDIVIQSSEETSINNLSFSINESDLENTLEILYNNFKKEDVLKVENLSKISLVGVGISNIPGVAAKMFEALYEKNIKVHMISTSEIKISVLVDENDAELAMDAVHNKFIQ